MHDDETASNGLQPNFSISYGRGSGGRCVSRRKIVRRRRSTGSRAAPGACRAGFPADRLALAFGQTARLVAHADQEHRLPRVLEDVDNPVLLIFEVNRLCRR